MLLCSCAGQDPSGRPAIAPASWYVRLISSSITQHIVVLRWPPPLPRHRPPRRRIAPLCSRPRAVHIRPPTPPPPVDSSTYALAYILEGRGHFTIADDASDVQHIQAGDTVLAPTNMGRYHSTVDPADADASPGSLARLLLVLPSEVFAADAEQPDAHTQSYQSVISTWKHWQACPTVGHLTQHDVHTLLSRRQPSELQAVVERETAPHSLLPSLTDWHTALTVSGRALLRGLHAALTPWSAASRPLIIKRAFDDLEAFQLPNQTNVLALVFDPLQHPVPFTFGVEIFQASHKTPPHVHPNAHENVFHPVWYVETERVCKLSMHATTGKGEGFCDGQRFPVAAGDLLLFPPKSVHGIDVSDDTKMYCLEFMLPNEMFAEFVRNGTSSGLQDDDLCQLNVISC